MPHDSATIDTCSKGPWQLINSLSFISKLLVFILSYCCLALLLETTAPAIPPPFQRFRVVRMCARARVCVAAVVVDNC